MFDTLGCKFYTVFTLEAVEEKENLIQGSAGVCGTSNSSAGA